MCLFGDSRLEPDSFSKPTFWSARQLNTAAATVHRASRKQTSTGCTGTPASTAGLGRESSSSGPRSMPVCGAPPGGRLFKEEGIPVTCCRTSTDNPINAFSHDQLKLGVSGGHFLPCRVSPCAVRSFLRCVASPDLCSHVSNRDSSALAKKKRKKADQLNWKQRKKTSKKVEAILSTAGR